MLTNGEIKLSPGMLGLDRGHGLGLEAEKPGLGLGLVGFGLGLVGFGLEPRGLSRPTTETERNVIGSKSITTSQKSLMPLLIKSWSYTSLA